jgi:hypothetical protein
MKREDFDAWEQRIRDRAELLWIEDGRPDGPRDRFLEEARELIAIEENPEAGRLDPLDEAEPLVEEASLMRNLGEFPTLVDQGEERTYPDDEDEIRLSDADASDTGGVLPEDEVAEADLPEVTMAEADITSDSLDTRSARATMNPDINDDGLPDQPALDDDDGDGEDDDFDDDDLDEDDPEDDEEEDEENARNDLAERAGVTVLGRR